MEYKIKNQEKMKENDILWENRKNKEKILSSPVNDKVLS